MSLLLIRAALETALAAVSPAVATAYENAPFTVPAPNVPYQQATLLPAEPDNPEIGPAYFERGLFQVNLFYPKDGGAAAAAARAALIRAAFPFGSSLVNGGVTVNITATPEIGPARAEDDRFFVPVRIRFHAYIAS
jgi:hypothetical protein